MAPAILTTLLFSMTAVFATRAAMALGPVRANMWRLLVAVGLLAMYAHGLGHGLGGGQFLTFFLAGIVGFGAGGWCMFQAFPRIGSTLSLLVVECSAAVLTVLLAWVLLGERISFQQFLLVVLVIGGLLVALAPFRLPVVSKNTLLSGMAFAALAACGQSVSWILTKLAFIRLELAGTGIDPLSAAYQRLIGGACLGVLVYLLHRVSSGKTSDMGAVSSAYLPFPRIPPFIWVIANALAGPVLGVSCMLWAIREVNNPGLVQAVVATATLFTVPLAKRMERRIFRPHYFIGATASLAGVAGLVLQVQM
ncbi:MAG: EamA family transporter [Puniceicoccaceae bacterium]